MDDPKGRTSTPSPDPVFSSDPGYSAGLAGAFLSDRLPLGVNEASGGGAAPHAECRLVEVHGVKVASFTVDGAELICLPQVFQLFLRHLVGGLHTVYTKLKRLRINPVVCTVEQVRVLRGLGAIQPGVNRCKLISRTDFEALYRDCTSPSSRPGRPPKRSLGFISSSSRLLPHGLLSPALLSQSSLTAVMAEALRIHKMRKMIMHFHGNVNQSEANSENNNTGGNEGSWEREQRLLSPSLAAAPPAGSVCLRALQQHSRITDLPFMVMPHPLLPVGLPPAGVAMEMTQLTQLSGPANLQDDSQTDDKGLPAGSPSPSDQGLHLQEPTSRLPSGASSPSSPPPPEHPPEPGDTTWPLPLHKPANDKIAPTQLPSFRRFSNSLAPLLMSEGLSSMETLLTNIQGLLKMAAESARSQSKRSQTERRELELELDKERDVRQTLQRQLSCELQTQVSMQRRLKKEKKAKRKLQEALDLESGKREKVERSLKTYEGPTENPVFIKPPLLF
ncbi:dachshund homolog 2-like [Cyprinodon tularosa]|uniref:dachshund homolog 2-like n=1 Tax=Cyprinodon tularosa TaxID=77115 RepID=UPI0018E272B9|nr:dachshund homolog 2-like [Cyprinodon tularosa]